MSETRVDIFLCNTQKKISEHQLLRYLELLPRKEKIKLTKLSGPRHYRRLISLALLYSELAKKTGSLPENLIIDVNPNGKPFLKNLSKYRFNLSHTANFTALAITEHDSIGLDIENLDFPRKSPSEISKRFFSLRENDMLSQLRGDDYLTMFYRLWTLKESWVKANGASLIPNLKKIEFLMSEKKLIANNQTKLSDGRFMLCRPLTKLLLAFCTLNLNREIMLPDFEIKIGLPLQTWIPIEQKTLTIPPKQKLSDNVGKAREAIFDIS